MRRLIVFNQVSLDGYFTGLDGDISWAHKNDAEWNEFVADNANSDGPLLFGRITYEMMAGFWPTQQAIEGMPAIANSMNSRPKVVFSKKLNNVSWNNTKLVKENIVEEVRKMKNESGDDMAILGSGTIVSQLAEHGLIDEYQLVINQIALGDGRTMFEGIGKKLNLQLIKQRTFNNGSVLVCYEPKE